MPATLFASGLLSPLGIHLSTPMLIAIGVLAWIFWPKLKAAVNPPMPSPPQSPIVEAAAAIKATAAPLQPSVAGEFSALEGLLAQRDKLQSEVTQALARAKSLIDKETTASAVGKP